MTGGSSTTIGGTIQTGTNAGPQGWTVVNTDNTATPTTVSTSGTVTVYNYAAAGIPATVTLAAHVGTSFGTQALSIANTATGAIYSEGLDATASGEGFATLPGASSIVNLSGGSSSTMTVGLSGGTAERGRFGQYRHADPGPDLQWLEQRPGQHAFAHESVAVQAMVFSGSAQWTGTADGTTWSNNGNWTDMASNATAGAPGISGTASVNDTATFAGSNSASITLDTSPTVAALSFTNSAGYTLTGTNALNLEASSGTATVTVLSGIQLISAPLVMAGSGSLAVSVSERGLVGTFRQRERRRVGGWGAGVGRRRDIDPQRHGQFWRRDGGRRRDARSDQSPRPWPTVRA